MNRTIFLAPDAAKFLTDENKTLSVQYALNGLFFSVKSKRKRHVIKSCDTLQEFLDDELATAQYDAVNWFVDTCNAAFFPQEAFEPSLMKEYAAAAGIVVEPGYELRATAPVGGMTAIMAVDSKVVETVNARFAPMRINWLHPLHTNFLSYVEGVLMNLGSGSVAISMRERGQMQYAEVLPYDSPETLLYYAKEFDRYPITLCGTDFEQHETFLRRYIPHVTSICEIPALIPYYNITVLNDENY